MPITKKTTTKSTSKAKTASKPTTVKMYNEFTDMHADVHPQEVENYRKGGFVEVK